MERLPALHLRAGLLICSAVALPLGVINLEDNMFVQIASFVLLIVCEAAWVVQFFYSGLTPQLMPAINPNADFSAYGPAFATVVFNYGYVTTVWSRFSFISAHRPVRYL